MPKSHPSSDSAADLAQMVAQTCLCLAVQRASRAVGRSFDEAFRPLGLTNWQFSLLALLSRPEPFTVTRLADALGTDRTTITSNLKPLARRGLVEIGADAGDRRVRRIGLTPCGLALLEEAGARWREVNAAVEARLGEVDPITLRTALHELAHGHSAKANGAAVNGAGLNGARHNGAAKGSALPKAVVAKPAAAGAPGAEAASG